ncbi:hypothetical protein INT48_000123 [Thamnidium elegans]|uniref:Uncharacterized protein n=1 Tax=Thamnidium elegans TaxID=101142 RepID=A0A8H7W188_9FUNG|nr:hypothetical protein INT48_000123 [Thamnidium elegans]
MYLSKLTLLVSGLFQTAIAIEQKYHVVTRGPQNSVILPVCVTTVTDCNFRCKHLPVNNFLLSYDEPLCGESINVYFKANGRNVLVDRITTMDSKTTYECTPDPDSTFVYSKYTCQIPVTSDDCVETCIKGKCNGAPTCISGSFESCIKGRCNAPR